MVHLPRPAGPVPPTSPIVGSAPDTKNMHWGLLQKIVRFKTYLCLLSSVGGILELDDFSRCCAFSIYTALALKVGRQGRQIQNCSYSIFCKLKFLLPFGDGTQ